MNKCTYCGKEYSDEVTVCPVDGEKVGSQGAPSPPTGGLSGVPAAGPGRMTIKTDITPKDVKALSRHVMVGTDGGRTMYAVLIGSALVMGAGMGLAMAFAGARLHAGSLWGGLIAGVAWLMIASRLLMRKLGPAADGYILGPRMVSVEDDGIRETTEKHESLFRWPAVRSADFVGEHVFVMVDRNAGIIVPRRAFESDAKHDQFLAEIRRRSGKASDGAAAQPVT